MSISVVIVAGGSGSRMKSDIPKQFMLLGGVPVLMRTIEALNRKVDQIVVVLPTKQIDRWRELCIEFDFGIEHKIAQGGATRFESVKNGLSSVDTDAELVLVHDGVRPFADGEMVERVVTAARASGAAIPVTEVVDSLRRVQNDCGESQIVDRSHYRAVQTPQAFVYRVIMEAYRQPFSPHFTDDASVVEQAGHKIELTQGDPHNIKITTQTDLEFANYIFKKKRDE